MNHPTSQVTTTAEVTIESQPGLYIRNWSGNTNGVTLRFTGPLGVQLMRSLATELDVAARELAAVVVAQA